MPYDWHYAKRQLLSYGAIVAITVAMAEGIFELMLRFPAYLPDQILPVMREYYYFEDQPYIQLLPDCAKYDAGLMYTLKPGSCRFAGREFDTIVTVNSLGVRDDERSLQSPEIFVLGDSFAMGWGVADNETFAALVGEETKLRVLNLAVSSYGTVRELEIAKRADASRLNTVIIQYAHNDMEENKTYLYNGDNLPISSENVYEAKKREHLNRTKYFLGKHLLWLIGRFAEPLFGAANAQESNREAKYFFNALFNKFEELSEQAGLSPDSTVVIVQGLSWPIEVSRAALSEMRDRPASISRLFLIGNPRRAGWRYPLDRHFTAIGHRELAEQIIKIIRGECYGVQEESEAKAAKGHSECDFLTEL
jgi:hypothetical protein